MMISEHTYALLDSGQGAKLEQVGPYRLVRPAPQAIWNPTHPASLWETAVARYHRSSSGGGSWSYRQALPETWTITYCGLSFLVKPTGFGHLGFFAEHGVHWQWLQECIRQAQRPVYLLNAFAYTGSSSLAAAAAGASVVHVDAAEGIVAWARENAQLAGLEGIRWIVEDITRFLVREIRRSKRYDVLVLDPPSFGRGARGEVWKLARDLAPLLELCRQVLSKQPLAVVLSCHTPGFTPLVLENLLRDMMQGYGGTLSSMEMVIPQEHGQRLLPSGALARWSQP